MNQNNIDSWMRRIKKYQLSTNTIINSPGVARVIFTVIVTFAVYPRLVLNRYFSWSAWRIASPVKLKNISTFFSLCPPHGEYFYAVLRIQLILMRIRIRILDPHWKKMDPNPDPNYWIFITKQNFQILCLICLLFCC